MNSYSYVANKYLKKNKKNIYIYIILYLILAFSSLCILGSFFTEFYFNNYVNIPHNKNIIVNVEESEKNSAIEYFEKNKYIIDFKEISNNNNNRNITFLIEIDNIKNISAFSDDAVNQNYQILISNSNSDSTNELKLIKFFNILFIMLLIILNVIYIYIIKNFIEKEKENVSKIKYLGGNNEKIFKLISVVSYKLCFIFFILCNLLFLSLLLINKITAIFYYRYFCKIIIIIFTVNIYYLLLSLILAKIKIKKQLLR